MDEAFGYYQGFFRFALAKFQNEKLFVSGGRVAEKGEARSIVYLIDMKRMVVIEGPSMNHKRGDHSMCQHGDSIFVFGGFDYFLRSKDDSSSLEMLKVSDEFSLEDRWQMIHIPKLYAQRNALICSVSQTEIFVMGGFNKKNNILSGGALVDLRIQK